jgi:diguanylate cyclase (GGDEF)-like protein
MAEMPTSRRSFRLARAYSIVSLLGILVVAVVMASFYRWVAVNALLEVQNEANHDLTQVFARPVWFKYAEFVEQAGGYAPESLAGRPEVKAMQEDVLTRMRGLRVVKVKIYDRSGLTVFSTEAKQIGERKKNNPGIQGALAGRVVSEIVFRDKFNAFDEVIEDRDLLSSYIPLRLRPDGEVVAVFELYSDITTLLDEVKKTELKIVALVAALMLGLYFFLLIYVRRADGIIRQLEAEERAMQQERIRYLAQHDQLTGLPNRLLLLNLLNQAIQRARTKASTVAVLYLDIDRFKLINDNLGHEGGNQILLELISRMGSLAGERSILGRIGGDEIVLAKEGLSAHGAEQLAARVIARLSEPLAVGDAEVTVTVSIGITLFPDDNHDAEYLLKDAEAAMKRAKELGRNRYAFFTEELNARAVERFELEHGLHKALANREYELHYQPRVEAVTGRVRGAEALLRWRREDGSIVSPALFIPILEEMGLIIPVGAWVLQAACRQCRAWRDGGHPDLHISVNLSVKQFHDSGLLTDIRNALLDSGLPADALELELTESVLAQDAENTAKLLRELKAIGVHLAIDDFGTGYSSLSYLMHFPIDCLKIDQAFVRDAISNSDHANLTRTIVAMAKSLHLQTVAEGVETEAHRDFIQDLNCDEMQGYFFSRPLPAGQFQDYLSTVAANRGR